MSLDCEGNGAACVECGEFDFLPYACPWCCGTFCVAHATYHHIPAHAAPSATGAVSAFSPNKAAGDAEFSSSPPLCSPPQETLRTLNGADATLTSSAPSALRPHRCVVCQSVLCALAPCPECGDCYCATHRFHGHEYVASKVWQKRRANQPAAPYRQHDRDGPTIIDPLASLCAPFTPTHPLVLAPVGYRSRRMAVLALIVAPVTATVTTLTGPTVGGGEAPVYTIGVCSLIVATEMSMGQVRDRLVGFLRDVAVRPVEKQQDSEATGLMLSSGWSEWVSSAHATLFTLTPAATATDKTAAVGSTSHRLPTLSLVQLPVDAILRKAPVVNATVLLSLSDAAKAEHMTPEKSSLQHLMTTILYGKFTSPSLPSPSTRDPAVPAVTCARRDDRVKALATRLYLQYQQLLRRSATDSQESIVDAADTVFDKAERPNSQPTEDRTGTSAQRTGALLEPAPDAEGDATPCATTVSDVAGRVTPSLAAPVWPFRHPPPLNSFDFFNTKLRPCGASAIRPAAAPRVVVAVFVADTALPVALKPMCIALGRDWPLCRVVDRLREEVGEQQLAQHRDSREALNTFSVYRLGSGTAGSLAGVDTEGLLTCLWSGHTRASTSSTPVTLHNGDVLLLCPAGLSGAEAALKEELQRLRELTGKAKAALKEAVPSVLDISSLIMSEAVVRAERELCAYVVALQSVLQAATEDAMPQSLWDGPREKDSDAGDLAADGSPHGKMPDTLIQQVERETALERRRIHELVRRRLEPQRAALRAAIVQLGGGQDASGNIIDVPVAVLDQEIETVATESAALGRRMVELYDEVALLATRIEAEVMSKSVPPL